MLFCYVDESGTCDPYIPTDPSSAPVFVIVGITVASRRQKDLTMDYVRLKQEFEPHLRRPGRTLRDSIAHEIKGSKLRTDVRSSRSGRNTRRRALSFMSRTLDLLERHGCRVMGKVVVKADGFDTPDKREYPKAVQELAVTFDSQCAASKAGGIMILDGRTKVKNEGNVHSITTRRFRSGGDFYPQLLEAPVFGHSDTHVPLQIADVVASAIVFPTACVQYAEAGASIHSHENYAPIREQFGRRLAALEHRYVNADGAVRGGFQVIDPIGKRPTHLLFRG
jgi:hypothetical protein